MKALLPTLQKKPLVLNRFVSGNAATSPCYTAFLFFLSFQFIVTTCSAITYPQGEYPAGSFRAVPYEFQNVRGTDTSLKSGNEIQVLVFPNPFTSEGFRVSVTAPGNEPVSIRIISITGQLIHSQILVSADQLVKPGNDLPAGMYFLEVQKGDYKKVVKLKKIE